MAKICPFLESKTDIFSCYLPVSDINLATEKSIWLGPSVLIDVCASCLRLQMEHYQRPLSLCLQTDSGRLSELISAWIWTLSFVAVISVRIWGTAVQWQQEKCLSCRLGSSARCTLRRLISELSIIYIQNDPRIIYQFISITFFDMPNVQRCKQMTAQNMGTDGEGTL